MTKTYKFDPHTHTAEVSGCSFLDGAMLAEMYHAAGFSGIAVTDHLYEPFVAEHKDWDTCISRFLRGYKNAKKRGDELGLSVVLGVELRFTTGYGDYLLYGLDEGFLRQNPYINRLTHREFYKRYGNELLIIQAHPYRGSDEPNLGCINGVEVYNGNPRQSNRNELTQALYASRPELYATSASDAHRSEDVGAGWMEFDRPVVDSRQFRMLIMQGGYRLRNAL